LLVVDIVVTIAQPETAPVTYEGAMALLARMGARAVVSIFSLNDEPGGGSGATRR
jgi:hypothetical protein